MHESTRVSDSCLCHTYEGVMSLSHVTNMIQSRHAYYCVISHVCISHVTHMNESWLMFDLCLCHTYEWVMSHIWMSHATNMIESYHMCDWVMSHIWMSHTYKWVMLRAWLSHTYECAMTQSHMWHDSIIFVARLIHMCDMTHSYVIESRHTYKWVMLRAWLSQVKLKNVLYHTNIWGRACGRGRKREWARERGCICMGVWVGGCARVADNHFSHCGGQMRVSHVTDICLSHWYVGPQVGTRSKQCVTWLVLMCVKEKRGERARASEREIWHVLFTKVCSVLQCVCCRDSRRIALCLGSRMMERRVLQRVAACCSVL